MATKRGKKAAPKTTKGKGTKGRGATSGGARPAAPARKTTDRRATPAARPPVPRAARQETASRPAPTSAGPSLLDRAVRLRDVVQESKLTAADPWGYTPKARGWTQRAQALVDEIARGDGDAAALGRRLEALTAEVESDSDYQEARRRS